MTQQIINNKRSSEKGFSLVELLLVMVVVSMFIVAGVGYIQQRTFQSRMDLTALQLQQILNASLSYYVANGSWPVSAPNVVSDLSLLQTGTIAYIPAGTLASSPWATTYSIYSSGNVLYAWVPISMGTIATTNAYAKTIAGRLPAGFIEDAPPASLAGVTDCAATTCYVVTAINAPGQDVQNSTNVNFAGLYHPGACVPVPVCPVDSLGNTMTPQIMVVPVSVSGLNDSGQMNVYPISSFTAYAVGGSDQTPAMCTGASSGNPSSQPSCTDTAILNGPVSQKSWRVCMQVITEKGELTNITGWGSNTTVMAITRCAMTGDAGAGGAGQEPAGSNFTVYSN